MKEEKPAHSDPTRAQKIMAGGDITQNVSHHSETNVYNQDPTSVVKTCVVSGRNARITEGYTCKSCGKWAHHDFFDTVIGKCDDCSEKNQAEISARYRAKVMDALQDGDAIDEDERSGLDNLANKLGLTYEKASGIERQCRKILFKSFETLSPRDNLLFKQAIGFLDSNQDDEQAFEQLKNLSELYSGHDEIAQMFVTAAIRVNPKKGLEFLSTSPCFREDSARKSFFTIELLERMDERKRASIEERRAMRAFGHEILIQAKLLERVIDLFLEGECEQGLVQLVRKQHEKYLEVKKWQKPEDCDLAYVDFVDSYFEASTKKPPLFDASAKNPQVGNYYLQKFKWMPQLIRFRKEKKKSPDTSKSVMGTNESETVDTLSTKKNHNLGNTFFDSEEIRQKFQELFNRNCEINKSTFVTDLASLGVVIGMKKNLGLKSENLNEQLRAVVLDMGLHIEKQHYKGGQIFTTEQLKIEAMHQIQWNKTLKRNDFIAFLLWSALVLIGLHFLYLLGEYCFSIPWIRSISSFIQEYIGIQPWFMGVIFLVVGSVFPAILGGIFVNGGLFRVNKLDIELHPVFATSPWWFCTILFLVWKFSGINERKTTIYQESVVSENAKSSQKDMQEHSLFSEYKYKTTTDLNQNSKNEYSAFGGNKANDLKSPANNLEAAPQFAARLSDLSNQIQSNTKTQTTFRSDLHMRNQQILINYAKSIGLFETVSSNGQFNDDEKRNLSEHFEYLDGMELSNFDGSEFALQQILSAKDTKALTLDLSEQNISNIEILAHLTDIRYIFLIGNNIRNLQPLLELKNLMSIDLEGNPISSDQLEALRSSIPDCKVFFSN